MAKTKYGLTVQLDGASADLIADNIAGDAPLPIKLEGVASGLLSDLAKGGIMIPPAYADRIRTATGQLDAVDITERCEGTVGMKGESHGVNWWPDPMWEGYLQNLADNQGITLHRQVETVMNHAFEQGWFGSAAPDPWKLLLTKEQYEWLEKTVGKQNVNGQDLIDFVEGKTGTAAFVQSAEADDAMEAVFGKA
jgi:hypothetical protein